MATGRNALAGSAVGESAADGSGSETAPTTRLRKFKVTFNRDRRVATVAVVRSTGSAVLDHAAVESLDMPGRALKVAVVQV